MTNVEKMFQLWLVLIERLRIEFKCFFFSYCKKKRNIHKKCVLCYPESLSFILMRRGAPEWARCDACKHLISRLKCVPVVVKFGKK